MSKQQSASISSHTENQLDQADTTSQILNCYSGGCEGTDFEWTKTFGRKSIVCSFANHHQRVLPNVGEHVITLTKQELSVADQKLDEANKYLRRRSTKFNLLRRNYYIISKAQSCYAIVEELDNKTASNKNTVRIKRGTAWGCQMFLLKYIQDNQIQDRKKIQAPLYVFCQAPSQCKWYGVSMDVEKSKIVNIDWIEMKQPKSLSGNFAGIGIRAINDEGKHAIKKLAMDASFLTMKASHVVNPTKNPYPVISKTSSSSAQLE